MQVGKIKKSTLERSVLRPLYGQNFAGRMHGPKVCVVEGWTLAAERLVYSVLNEGVAAGIEKPEIALEVTIPEEAKEPQLKQLMLQIGRLCEQEGSEVSSVQVFVSHAVNTLVMTGAVCGGQKMTEEATIEKRPFDIVAVGTAGREGTALLTHVKKEALLLRYTEEFLKKAEYAYENASFLKVQKLLHAKEVIARYPVREGGFFAALWELSEKMKMGFDISLKDVPIMQHTIEVCEFFGLNPYQLLGGGMMILACENGEEIVRHLKEKNVQAAVIGKMHEKNEKIIRYDDEARNLEPPKQDEILRV